MKIAAFFVVLFVVSMAAIMTLQRFPTLLLMYGRRFKRFNDEIDETSLRLRGRDGHDRFALWCAVITSLILAALGTGAAHLGGAL